MRVDTVISHNGPGGAASVQGHSSTHRTFHPRRAESTGLRQVEQEHIQKQKQCRMT